MPTYYEILGLPNDAPQDVIRKRFRELAREHHPDVARSPGADARFRSINEAHQVLSDPVRRSTYDAELKLARLRQEREQRRRDAASGAAKAGQAGQAPPAGKAPSRPAGTRAQPQGGVPPPRPAAAPGITAATAMAEAQKAFARMRYRDAETLCRYALRMDRRNASACEMLGDLYRIRGRIDDANRLYSYAVQFAPPNQRVQAKIERLMGRPMRADGGWQPRPTQWGLRPGRVLGNGIGLAALVVLPVALSLSTASVPTTALWLEWSPLLLGAMAIAGLACGLLLAVNGVTAYARDEMATASPRPNGRLAVPMGLLLLGFTLVSFYVAFLAYVLVGFAQETVSRSVVRTFAAAFVITALFALFLPAGAPMLLLTGGNVVFPALLLGWFIGDQMR